MRITRVYTKTGDDGSTGLVGGQRVAKDDPRIEAYGTSDELMSFLGLARLELAAERDTFADPADSARLDTLLEFLANKLFTLGADLATRVPDRHPMMAVITPEDIAWLERVCDSYNENLPPLKDFILPGGSRTAASLHIARTVARRAERAVQTLSRGEDPGPHPSVFLNRLSDALFVLARWANHRMGVPEVIWRRDLPAPE